ncbi:hypothetical protein CJ030_MR3G018270 [Morella rubra]|uniref:Uncharacterized protein n=1 Tax=Morella rubra TaxID=262757 RepID=A0A6A1W1U7_9ROSI|nr:hypothetical protein CJ030_MR3G018270 [Morella rubra]
MNTEDMVLARQGQALEFGGVPAKKRKEAVPSSAPTTENDKTIEVRADRPKLQFKLLNSPVRKILMEIRNDLHLQWPSRIGSDPNNRDNNKFFSFQ